MTTSPAQALLLAPSLIHPIQPFCEAHFAGIFAQGTVDVDTADVDTAGIGMRIAQTLEAGTLRPLRPVLTAAPSATPHALPAAFPTGHPKRLIAAHALLFALAGVPAIHLHHLLMQATADVGEPEATWAALSLTQRKAFDALVRLLHMRAEHEAFARESEQHPLELPAEICAVVRTAKATQPAGALPLHPLPLQRRVVCLVNVSAHEHLVSVDWRAVLGTRHAIRDLVSGVRFNVHGPSLALQPYQVLWATL